MDADPFNILKNIKTIGNSGVEGKVAGTFSGIYIVFLNIFTIGLACSFIICGLNLMFTTNANGRSEAKKELLWKGVIAIVAFAFTFFVDIFYGISKSFI